MSKLGGFRVQGKSAGPARRLLDDALALEDAGCFAIVLEAVPDRVAAYITEKVRVPTIGIGAGPSCSGQVLVWHDMLGLFDRFLPKFAMRFADAGEVIEQGLTAFVEQVRSGAFPRAEHSFTIKDAEWESFREGLPTSSNGSTEAGEETPLYGRDAG
jgi:3-methyl-2-oxobutanoate hydroxymethyltransferase